MTATTATIHRSNLVRSIANSMSAAKKIERDAIRFRTHVQIHDIRRTQPEFSLNIFILPLLLPASAKGLVKLHERQTLVQLGLHQVEFR
jgi:hypothetical protein